MVLTSKGFGKIALSTDELGRRGVSICLTYREQDAQFLARTETYRCEVIKQRDMVKPTCSYSSRVFCFLNRMNRYSIRYSLHQPRVVSCDQYSETLGFEVLGFKGLSEDILANPTRTVLFFPDILEFFDELDGELFLP